MSGQSITELSARLQKVEDELAVRNLMVRYGLAVDGGDSAAAESLFTKDSIYDVAAPDTGMEAERGEARASYIMEGPDDIAAMVEGPGHQSLLPNSAHTLGPDEVWIEGDIAYATGYSRLYLKEGDEFRLLRLSINSWTFKKQIDGRWLIHRRATRPRGGAEAHQILKDTVSRYKKDSGYEF